MIAELIEEVEQELDLSELMRIAEACDTKYMDDVEKAVTAARKRIRALKNFDDYRDKLIDLAIRRLVHRSRWERNHATKVAAGVYRDIMPKVVSGTSNGVREASQKIVNRWLDHAINGTRIGSLLFEQLPVLRKAQLAAGDGAYFNASLLSRLEELGSPGKRVEEFISERKLKVIAESLRNKGARVA